MNFLRVYADPKGKGGIILSGAHFSKFYSWDMMLRGSSFELTAINTRG